MQFFSFSLGTISFLLVIYHRIDTIKRTIKEHYTMKKKKRIDKRNYLKLKSFCMARETISWAKRQLPEREKILAGYIFERGLIKYTKNSKN